MQGIITCSISTKKDLEEFAVLTRSVTPKNSVGDDWNQSASALSVVYTDICDCITLRSATNINMLSL